MMVQKTTLTALASVEVQQAFADANVGEPAIEAELRLRCLKNMNMLQILLTMEILTFPF